MTCNIAATVTTPTPTITASVGSVAVSATVTGPAPTITASVASTAFSATVTTPTPTITASVASEAIAATVSSPTPTITVTNVSVGGDELNSADRAKLDSVEYGSQRNREIVHELWATRAISETEEKLVTSATYEEIAHGNIDRGTWTAGGKMVMDVSGTFIGVAGAKLQFKLEHNGALISNEVMQLGMAAGTLFRHTREWSMGRLKDSGTIGGVARQQWKTLVNYNDTTGAMQNEVNMGQTDIDFLSDSVFDSHEILLKISLVTGTGTARISSSTCYIFGHRESIWGDVLNWTP